MKTLALWIIVIQLGFIIMSLDIAPTQWELPFTIEWKDDTNDWSFKHVR